jgi:hypothetical protein
MNLLTKDLRDHILIVVKQAHPRTLTHGEAAYEVKRTKGFDHPNRVAANMVFMSRDGTLELVRDGWDGRSHTKRYRLPQ